MKPPDTADFCTNSAATGSVLRRHPYDRLWNAARATGGTRLVFSGTDAVANEWTWLEQQSSQENRNLSAKAT